MKDLIVKLMTLRSRFQDDIAFKIEFVDCIDKVVEELNKVDEKLGDDYQMLEVSQVAQWLYTSNSFVIDSFKSKGIPMVIKSIEKDSQKPKYLIPVSSYKQYIKECQYKKG